MGNYYRLANFDRKEYIRFVGCAKGREIILNQKPSQLVAFYLFEHNGDRIGFVGDEWTIGMPFEHATWDNMQSWKDVTEETEDGLKEVLEEGK